MEPRRQGRPTGHDLERYAKLFAARTRVMKSSAMRDLMALTERPEVISLAGGLPDTSTFERASYAAIQQRVGSESLARALQYGPTEGLAPLKRCIVEVMAQEATHVGADELLVTTGGQQAIDLVCKTLIDPGDVVVAEGPTYPGAVPTFQNPAGVTMSLPRRRRLVEVARERELLVVEDNPYGMLRYSGEALPTLRSMEGGDFVIYLGTFSKILSPGIRLGWVAAPGPVLEKLNLGKQATDLCSSAFTQMFVATLFEEPGAWLRYVDVVRETYRVRRDAMLEALDEHLGAVASWT
ncbi:MAG TPA: PLP-dependent aminotransferase family protein, partial [Solirubrobacteraceae bacterium]|nr:PLP-dependent aminotransferase family protein [Solirubrobacteraceae bacterium]